MADRSDGYIKVKINEGEYAGETYTISVAELGYTPAIHIEQSKEDDGTRVTIANCTISRDGFSPLTVAVQQLSARLTLLGWSFFGLLLLVAFVVAT